MKNFIVSIFFLFFIMYDDDDLKLQKVLNKH